jgi:putative spermidine/putrescine transport system ATP-binding protein
VRSFNSLYVTHDQEEALSISDRVVVMNEGRMEQVGTPFEIYNFPKTDFVAHFVGTLNALKAEVCDAAAGLLVFAGKQIQTAQKLGTVRSGETTTISLRPERLGFAADGKKVNVLDCTVENITFLGSIVRIQVKAGEQTLYMDTFNNPFLELPRLGDKTQITFSSEAVLVLDRGPNFTAPNLR